MSNIRTHNSRSIRTAGLGLFVALVLAASACGGSDGDDAAGTPTAETTPVATATATATPAPTSAPVAEQTAEPETEVAEPEEEATSVPEEEATPAPEPAVEQPTVEVTPVPEPTAVSTPEAAQPEPPTNTDGEDVLDVTVEDIPPAPEPVGDVIHIWPQDWDSIPILETRRDEQGRLVIPYNPEGYPAVPYVIVDGVQVGSRLSYPLSSWDIPPAQTVVVRAIESPDDGYSVNVFFCGYDTWDGTRGEGYLLFVSVLLDGRRYGKQLSPGQILFDLPWNYRDPALTYPNEYGDVADPGAHNIHWASAQKDPSCS